MAVPSQDPQEPSARRVDDAAPAPSPSHTTRRRFLASASAATAAVAVAGTLPERATAATFIDQSFDGLAAFVVPGNDKFSKHQRLTVPSPGGVDAMAGRVLKETFDAAIPLTVSDHGQVAAPGALGLALLLEAQAVNVNPLSTIGPFSSPFANLTWTQKREVLQRLDNQALLNKASIEFAGGALVTLAALGAYSERAVYDRRSRELRGIPIGWKATKYEGVSDGWDEFIGYHQGRTEVTG